MYGLSGIVIVIPDSLLSRVIDANGTVVVEYTYDAWGKVLNVTGDDTETVIEFRSDIMTNGNMWHPSNKFDTIVIGGENGL